MSGLARQAFSWLRCQSDLTHNSLAVAATAVIIPLVPSLPPTALATLNLASMSILFGTQTYVALVGGPTMFVNLPRITFGDIQARLFPKMGMVCMATGALTLASYSVNHSVDTASYLLGASLAINILNSFIIFPKVTELMLELRKHEEGTPERKKAGMRFGITHGVSNLINLGSMCTNLAYLYIIASRIVGHW
eukprot:GFUD01042415.1.p1 GENE.GFUD01042415.1~~GFUD01042415.1.p1  ORF type:complete len:193 (+),score=53.32 GFUD01042415.1:40-618(+)